MGILKIECYCSHQQMTAILNKLEHNLYSTLPHEVADVDDTHLGVRVCVDYQVLRGDVSLINAELLDAEWDVLPEDSAVLTSCLKKIVRDYNIYMDRQTKQGKEIRRDQLISRNIHSSILD